MNSAYKEYCEVVHDTVIRGGQCIDGTGTARFVADIAQRSIGAQGYTAKQAA